VLVASVTSGRGYGVRGSVDAGTGAADVGVRRGRRLGACGRGRGCVRLGIALPPAKPPAKPTMRPNRNPTPPTAVVSSHRRLRRSAGGLCMDVVGSDIQVNLTDAAVSPPRRRRPASRAAPTSAAHRRGGRSSAISPMDLVTREHRGDEWEARWPGQRYRVRRHLRQRVRGVQDE
jgi:hypothetical protein